MSLRAVTRCSMLLTLALFCQLCVKQTFAQALYGSLVGTVTDSSGAIVPRATVDLTDKQTGVARKDAADESGRYSFVNVAPGNYDIKITAPGFRSFAKTDLNIVPGTIIRTDATLEVGQTSETVTVEGSAAQLQTDKADTHTTIDAKEIQSIPLPGYRNYQTLLNLTPGATPAQTQNSITDTPGRALATHVNGGSAQTNITRIDGAESVNVWLPHHVGYVMPEEAIEVVNITTSAADAEQGMAGSSAITLITRSGTNEIHGSAFEYHDDQHLRARDFFQVGPTKPLSIFNDFGGTVGGPIIKNKLYYFVSYDGTRQRQAIGTTYTVPTAAFEAGNFSSLLGSTTIYNPYSATGANGAGRVPFAGNLIPTNLISPIAAKIQSYYPGANNGSGFTNNFYAAGGPVLDRNQLDAKVNYNLNDKHSMWFKYGRLWATAGGKAVFGVAGGPGLGGSDPATGNTTIQLGSIGHTWTLTPNLLLDGVLAYERMDQTVRATDFGTNYGQQLGIPNTNGPDPLQSGFPNIGIQGYNNGATAFGVANWIPATRVEETYTQSDNLSWTKGSHQLRFGFDLVRHHLNHWQPEIGQGPRGYLGFSGQETIAPGGSANQYNGYAAFLLGLSDDAEKSLQNILMTTREWQFGWYAQDRWQVTRNLTITAGVRYELYPIMTRSNGKGIERYDPATNLVYLGGRGNVPEGAGVSASHKLFAPRVGIAWRMNEKTVLRTGYGINEDPLPVSRPLRGWYPLTINSANVASGLAYSSTLTQGVPNPVGPDLSTGIIPLPGNVSERSPDSFFHRGYVQNWNFTLERQLPSNIIGSLAYVGSQSTHLSADYDINSGYAGSGTAGLPYNTAAYGNRTIALNMWDGYLSSHYHSLQASATRSFSRGFLIKAAYTWSKTIDFTDDDGWASTVYNDPTAFQRNRAAAGFDRTQVFQFAWVYELPFGKGKAFANQGLASKLTGGWQLDGNWSAYTGTPINLTASTSTLNAGATNQQTPNQVLGTVTQLGGIGTGNYYYNPAAFAAVTGCCTYGNSGRNTLRGPGLDNVNISLSRTFPIKERLTVAFRAEAMNSANHPQFSNPGTSISSGTFLQITSTNANTNTNDRQFRFSLKVKW
jgi:hypothetical protein